MKKTYKSPNTVVCRVVARHRLMGGSAYGTGVKGSANSKYETLSRRNSVWEDDEE